jgi:hypothetical protein
MFLCFYVLMTLCSVRPVHVGTVRSIRCVDAQNSIRHIHILPSEIYFAPSARAPAEPAVDGARPQT